MAVTLGCRIYHICHIVMWQTSAISWKSWENAIFATSYGNCVAPNHTIWQKSMWHNIFIHKIWQKLILTLYGNVPYANLFSKSSEIWHIIYMALTLDCHTCHRIIWYSHTTSDKSIMIATLATSNGNCMASSHTIWQDSIWHHKTRQTK